MSGLDVARLRGLYPTLAEGTAQLDGAYAALPPESVIRSVIATMRQAPTQPGSRSARSQQAVTALSRARRAAADLVGGRVEDVLLAGNTAGVLLRLATAFSDDWQLGDDIVVNRLDSDLMLLPWLRIARGVGAVVHWAEVDLETGELPAWQYRELITPRTRVVTVALGNPATGTTPDVAAIAEAAHAVGALVVADAGAAIAHVPLDLGELGVDVLTVTGSTFGAPNVAAAITRTGLLGELLAADIRRIPPRPLAWNAQLPLPVELLDGFTAAVDHLAALDQDATGSRRERLLASIASSGKYTAGLYDVLDRELRALDGVYVLGPPGRTVPTAAFTVAGYTADEIGAHLHVRSISAWTGPAGMSELLRAYGADEIGGAVFIGLMPYTTRAEVERLLQAIRAL